MQSNFKLPFKPTPIRDILGLFLGTRLLLILATYFSFILFPVPPHVYPELPVNFTGLLRSWNRWDSLQYLQIAQHGYQSIHYTAFFPLYPLLLRGLAFLFGDRWYTLATLLLSNLAFFGVLYILYQIATDVLGERVGRRTILYLCIFPTAIFFFAGYNESLFLFFSCSSIFAMRHRRWVLAGLLGLLAALTRSAGVLLVVPYLCELWVSREESHPKLFEQVKGLFPRALSILLIPLGTSLYMLYCWRLFHDPLAFATAQKDWGRVFTLPWSGIGGAFWQLFYRQHFGSFFEAHLLLDLTATLGFIALAVLGWKRLRLSYTLWVGLLILYMLSSSAIASSDTLVSNQRFVLEMFPAFITLAALGLKHPRVHQALIIAFPFLQAILAALFVLNRWMV